MLKKMCKMKRKLQSRRCMMPKLPYHGPFGITHRTNAVYNLLKRQPRYDENVETTEKSVNCASPGREVNP